MRQDLKRKVSFEAKLKHIQEYCCYGEEYFCDGTVNKSVEGWEGRVPRRPCKKEIVLPKNRNDIKEKITMTNIALPIINDATPCMDMYRLHRLLHKCTEVNAPKYRKGKNTCVKCPYYGTTDCWQRLMLDSAHAIALLLAERDEGKPLIAEGDGDD